MFSYEDDETPSLSAQAREHIESEYRAWLNETETDGDYEAWVNRIEAEDARQRPVKTAPRNYTLCLTPTRQGWLNVQLVTKKGAA